MNKKWLLTLMLAVFVSLLAACGEDSGSGDENKDEKQEQASGEQGENAQQQKMPEPDLKGIPDVVAKVNGEEIKKKEFTQVYEGQFQQMAMQSQMTGQEIDQDKMKKQVADSLVGQELLIQEADSRNLKAPQEEVDKKLEELAKQNKMESKDKFLKALKEQGMGEKEVMSQVKTQIKVDKLIAEEAGDTKPSEEEVKKAYEQMKAQQEKSGQKNAKVPSFEEAKPTIEQQLQGQKQAEATQKIVEDLRKDADVTVNI